MREMHSRRSALHVLVGCTAGLVSYLISVKRSNAMTLKPTPTQVDGPYFLPNAPFSTNLIPAGMTGDLIEVSGRVLATDGTPIANAMVHVWLADPKGVYDNQDSQGAPMKISVSQMKLRSRIVTDSAGAYKFTCLRPGNYDVGGGKMRPAHIHVMVEARRKKTLVTQLYFTDDQYNTHDLPGPGFFLPELLVPMKPTVAQTGVWQRGNFDFVLG